MPPLYIINDADTNNKLGKYMILWKEKNCNTDMSKGVPIYFTKIHSLPGKAGRIILRWVFRIGMGGGMDSIDLAQDRDR